MNHHHPPDDDPFIDRLRCQPLASPPDAWRTEILDVVMATVTSPSSRRQHVEEVLRAWLWPHPLAYAGLLAVWTMILALRWQTPLPIWRPTTQPLVAMAAGSGDSRGASLLLSAHDVNEDLAIRQQFLNRDFAEEGRP